MSFAWLFAAVTFTSAVTAVLALFFYTKLYRRLTRLLHIAPYKNLEYSWVLILAGSILLFAAFFYHEGLMYKFLELISLIAFLLAFMFPFLGFRKFILNLSLLKTYLRGDLEKYKIIILSVSGRLNVTKLIRNLASDLMEQRDVFLTLGPTPPYHFSKNLAEKILWVTLRGMAQPQDQIVTIEEDDPTRFNLEFELILSGKKRYPVLLGDHLNSFMMSLGEKTFYRYWSDFASKIRNSDVVGIFILNDDMHSITLVNFLKRFADILMELREVELKGSMKVQLCVMNVVDDIYTEWITLPS